MRTLTWWENDRSGEFWTDGPISLVDQGFASGATTAAPSTRRCCMLGQSLFDAVQTDFLNLMWASSP